MKNHKFTTSKTPFSYKFIPFYFLFIILFSLFFLNKINIETNINSNGIVKYDYVYKKDYFKNNNISYILRNKNIKKSIFNFKNNEINNKDNLIYIEAIFNAYDFNNLYKGQLVYILINEIKKLGYIDNIKIDNKYKINVKIKLIEKELNLNEYDIVQVKINKTNEKFFDWFFKYI